MGRKQRLNALFDELLTALHYGSVDQQRPLGATIDSALDNEERELMRRYVIEQIEQPTGKFALCVYLAFAPSES